MHFLFTVTTNDYLVIIILRIRKVELKQLVLSFIEWSPSKKPSYFLTLCRPSNFCVNTVVTLP